MEAKATKWDRDQQ